MVGSTPPTSTTRCAAAEKEALLRGVYENWDDIEEMIRNKWDEH